MAHLCGRVVEFMEIGSLVPYEKNAKKHPEKQIQQVANSIKEFGFNQPIVVDKNNVVVVGHGRLEAAKKLGLTKIPVIAVDLTEEQARAYRLADNKLNESDWDMGLVVEELKGLTSEMLDLTGFQQDLIIEPDEQDDVIPENVPPVAKLGDIWQLGEHRLMCGDSTKLEDVEKLMNGQKADMVLTDLPYNTGMEAKADSTRLNHMFNDSYTPEQWESFLKDIFANYYVSTKGEAAFYICIDWRKVSDVKRHIEELMSVSNVIVWDKMVHGLGSDYKYTYELIVVAKKGKPKINNRYGTDYQDVWHVQRKLGKNKDHATAKPIELLEKPIKHASKQNDIIMDLFGGSGSTLIASEKLDRKCYMMELEPKYVDVIIKRWEDFTGKKAVLL